MPSAPRPKVQMVSTQPEFPVRRWTRQAPVMMTDSAAKAATAYVTSRPKVIVMPLIFRP